MPIEKAIVIGGSAGSIEALVQIVRSLQADLPAAIFVVIHSPPRQKTYVPQVLVPVTQWRIVQAIDQALIESGHIYVAAPDRHLLLAQDHIHLSRGPKEGLHRPSINATFRTAAMAYGERVIGVLLSGMLDDGAAGLWEIANRGGITIVQDPHDAAYPSMPLNALTDAPIDYRLPRQEIGPLLSNLVLGVVKPKKIHPPETDSGQVFSGFTCPECRGPLFEVRRKGPPEFRCRVGHLMSLRTLVDEETNTQERKLYEAIVALQEGADLADYAAKRIEGTDLEAFRREAEQLRKNAEAVRKMLEERASPSLK